MSDDVQRAGDERIVRGEFFTDGEAFVFRVAGSPLSGRGASAQQAFDDLVRARSAYPDLERRLDNLARDQKSEAMRVTITRAALIALILFGAIGGAIVGAAAVAPRVAGQLLDVTTGKLGAWVDSLDPGQRDALSDLLEAASDNIRVDASAGVEAAPDSQ